MAGCFLPSHRLRPFFEDFLVEKKNENNQDAMHCHKKLIRSTQAMQQAPPSDAANGDIFYELRQQRRAPPCRFRLINSRNIKCETVILKKIK
jgi:hypothetical protein